MLSPLSLAYVNKDAYLDQSEAWNIAYTLEEVMGNIFYKQL